MERRSVRERIPSSKYDQYELMKSILQNSSNRSSSNNRSRSRSDDTNDVFEAYKHLIIGKIDVKDIDGTVRACVRRRSF